MSAQHDELNAQLATLQASADAAKVRDAAILKALTDLQNNPPAAEDFSDSIQKVKDLIAEEDTIGQGTPAAPEAPAA